MDIQTIDQEYGQLQTQAQQTAGQIRALAGKLQAAAQAGNQDAREWLLDLREVALAIQAEQNQVGSLLQALHGFLANQAQQMPAQSPAQSPWGGQPQPGYQQQVPYPQQPQGGGFLGNLLNSGFARAIETGAGFGIGDDIINKIL